MKHKPSMSVSRAPGLSQLAKNSRLANHSAVVILINKTASSLFMIKRAQRKGDPWSGDMAFPGGRKEPGDKDHVDTARRELGEETGLGLTSPPIGALNTLWTKSHTTLRPMAVHCYVFEASQAVSLKTTVNASQMSVTTDLSLSDEIADALWIPLAVFRPENRKYFIWKTRLGKLRMPCYYFQQHKIWGLSLRMIENVRTQPRFWGT